MGKGQSGKGTGKKRMSNPNYKPRRERSWHRGETRKQQHSREQAARENQNKKLHAEGKLSPWESVKLARQQRRAAERAAAGGQS